MDDLNDIYYFVKVVDNHGFTQAGRALNVDGCVNPTLDGGARSSKSLNNER